MGQDTEMVAVIINYNTADIASVAPAVTSTRSAPLFPQTALQVPAHSQSIALESQK